MMSILEDIIHKNKRTHGEYQLTDALQEMVNRGNCLKTIHVSTRYDCGARNLCLR